MQVLRKRNKSGRSEDKVSSPTNLPKGRLQTYDMIDKKQTKTNKSTNQKSPKGGIEDRRKPFRGPYNHVSWKPGTLIYPLPAVLISCGSSPEDYNVLTISWVGTICTNPPMCYISVRPERHSYNIIKETGEFVINLTNEDMAYATDWCGVKSGKDFNKFTEMKLTPVKGEMVNAPIVKESPLCIECRVKEIIPLGSHDMFIAEVINVQADSQYIDPETDTFKLSEAKLIAYSHGHYYKLGEEIGKFGWTVQKKKGTTNL